MLSATPQQVGKIGLETKTHSENPGFAKHIKQLHAHIPQIMRQMARLRDIYVRIA